MVDLPGIRPASAVGDGSAGRHDAPGKSEISQRFDGAFGKSGKATNAGDTKTDVASRDAKGDRREGAMTKRSALAAASGAGKGIAADAGSDAPTKSGVLSDGGEAAAGKSTDGKSGRTLAALLVGLGLRTEGDASEGRGRLASVAETLRGMGDAIRARFGGGESAGSSDGRVKSGVLTTQAGGTALRGEAAGDAGADTPTKAGARGAVSAGGEAATGKSTDAKSGGTALRGDAGADATIKVGARGAVSAGGEAAAGKPTDAKSGGPVAALLVGLGLRTEGGASEGRGGIAETLRGMGEAVRSRFGGGEVAGESEGRAQIGALKTQTGGATLQRDAATVLVGPQTQTGPSAQLASQQSSTQGGASPTAPGSQAVLAEPTVAQARSEGGAMLGIAAQSQPTQAQLIAIPLFPASIMAQMQTDQTSDDIEDLPEGAAALEPNELGATHIALFDDNTALMTGPDLDIVFRNVLALADGIVIALAGAGTFKGRSVTAEPVAERAVLILNRLEDSEEEQRRYRLWARIDGHSLSTVATLG